MFNREDFRKGKAIPMNNNYTFKERVCKVVSMDFLTAEELKLSKGDPNDLFLVFMIDVEGMQDLHREIQKVKVGANGELNNPMLPENTTKDGKYFPATIAYELWNRIRNYLNEMGDKVTLQTLEDEDGLTRDRYVGQSFRIGVMEIKGKDGKPNWCKLDTSSQRERDKYNKEKAANGEKVMEEVFGDDKKADLDDMPF